MHTTAALVPVPRPAPDRSWRACARPGRVIVLVVLAGASLGGCAQAVSVDVAPDGASPTCARVVLALPDELAGSDRLGTTSQATAAWGDAAAPIVLRCGVTPPGPTTDKCVSATDAAGASVDWLAVEGSADEAGGAGWTFTTYGREPAVEVTVPAEVSNDRSTSFLVDLIPAISKSPALRTCD